MLAVAVLAASALWCVLSALRTDLPWRRWRVMLLLGCRLILLAAVAAWCLDLRLDNPLPGKAVDLLVVADRSVSISPQGRATVDQWVNQCREGMKGRPGRFEVIDAASDDGRGSPLAESVQEAMLKFSRDSDKRLVLVTDGRATTADLMPLAGELQSQQVRLMVVPVDGLAGESLLADLRVAPSLWRSVPAPVEVTLQSPVAQGCKLTLLADGKQVDEKQAQLQPGLTAVELKYTPPADGVHRLEVKASFEKSAQDQFGGDSFLKTAQAIVDVPLAPRVIVITDTVASVAGAVKALQDAGMQVRALTPAELPNQFSADCIVLSNVPAEALGTARMQAMEQFVRDGGAMVFAGGPKSYAAGGYVGSAIENVFPVLLTPKKEYPPFALAVVLDNSWSMNEGYTSSVGKIDLAKEIAIAGLDGLNKGDWLLCISFDSDYHEIIPPTKVDNLEPAKYEIARIGAFGMTNILGGLAEAAKELRSIDAPYKHILLISDGQETETGTDYSNMLAQLERDKVTLTTIGIGLSPNEKLLNTLAYAGKGRYYHAKSLKEVPSVVLQEAKGVDDQLIVTMPLPVKKIDDDMALAGIDAASLGPVYGYNRSRARGHAWTPLVIGRKNDPLLARMRYGRGQSLAFMSAAASSWVKDWIAKTPVEYSTFWRQAVSSVLGPPYRAIDAKVRYTDGAPVFDFGPFAPGELTVHRQGAGLEAITSEKSQTPEVSAGGADALLVTAGEGTQYEFSWNKTYGREFADPIKAMQDMKAFCQAGGGAFAPSVAEALAPGRAAHRGQVAPDAWLVLAAVLLVAELLIRRLPVLTLLTRRKANQ